MLETLKVDDNHLTYLPTSIGGYVVYQSVLIAVRAYILLSCVSHTKQVDKIVLFQFWTYFD